MNPLTYAYIAQQAYSVKPTYGDPDSSARAIVGKSEDGTVISFPGTNNIACWLADLDIDVIDVALLGTVHSGFWQAFCTLRSQLMLESPSVLTGHSEGAALALLYGAALCVAGRPPRAIFAFESPRISIDPMIYELFEKSKVDVQIFRNGEDIVPCVPRILHDWQHPAEVIQIGKAILPIWNVEDHFIEKVIESLKSEQDEPMNFQIRVFEKVLNH